MGGPDFLRLDTDPTLSVDLKLEFLTSESRVFFSCEYFLSCSLSLARLSDALLNNNRSLIFHFLYQNDENDEEENNDVVLFDGVLLV